MKNQIILVTSTGISSATTLVYNCELQPTSTGASTSVGAKPQRIHFYNGSGKDVEFNMITREEFAEFQSNPDIFVGVLVPNSTYFRHHEILGKDKLEPQPSFVTVKGASSGATAGISIYCLDYI